MNLTTSEASVELPGSMVINGFIQNLLQGIIFCQVVHYWAAYTDDSKWKRLYVASFVFVSMYGIFHLSFALLFADTMQPSNYFARLQSLESVHISQRMGKYVFIEISCPHRL